MSKWGFLGTRNTIKARLINVRKHFIVQKCCFWLKSWLMFWEKDPLTEVPHAIANKFQSLTSGDKANLRNHLISESGSLITPLPRGTRYRYIIDSMAIVQSTEARQLWNVWRMWYIVFGKCLEELSERCTTLNSLYIYGHYTPDYVIKNCTCIKRGQSYRTENLQHK